MKKLSIISLLFVSILLITSCETESIDQVNSNKLQENKNIKTISGVVDSFENFAFGSKSNQGLDECNTFFGNVKFISPYPGFTGAPSGQMVVKACIGGFGPCATIFNGTVYNNSNFYFGAPGFSFNKNDRFNIKIIPDSGGFGNFVDIEIGPAFQESFTGKYFSRYGAAVGPDYVNFKFERCN